METLKEIFDKEQINERILKAFGNKRVILFLGAGISRLVGIPGWEDLSNKLIRKAFPTYKDQKMILDAIKSSKEKITISYQKFYRDGNAKEFFNIFEDAFNNKYVKEKQKSDDNIYKLLAKFPATFLTTNADDLFEKELGSALCHTELDMRLIERDQELSTGHLFYLHGKYTGNLKTNNMVFTAVDYVKKYNDTKTIKFLNKLFSNSDFVVVFLGYGLNEFELIDYIVTKAGLNIDTLNKRFFVLEGFLSNQDEIYYARKYYFDNLNIELIPYNLDKNGYEELKNVLTIWLNELKNKSNMPSLVNDEVEDCIRNYNDASSTKIYNILKDNSCDVQNEQKIASEISKSKNPSKWISFLIENKLFSCEYLMKILCNGNNQWPLLDLLNQNILIDSTKKYQDIIVAFLKDIIENKYEEKFEPRDANIVSSIVVSILLLDGGHIDASHIDFISLMVKKYGYEIFFIKYDIFKFVKFDKWKNNCFKKFLEIMSNTLIPLCNYYGSKTFYYSKILDAINKRLCNGNKSKWEIIVDWIIDLILEETKDGYSTLIGLYNIDNISKTHHKDCELIINEFEKAFLYLNVDIQNKIVDKLFSNKNEVLNKFAIHICRIAKLNLNLFIDNMIKVVDNDNCLTELYLCLYHNNNLIEYNENILFNKILNSPLGFNNVQKDNRIETFIISKRLALSKLLNCQNAKIYLERYKDIKPCDFLKRADRCDYVHENDYEDLEINEKYEYLEGVKIKLTEKDIIWHSQIISNSIDVLIGKEDNEFISIIEALKTENAELKNLFILNLFLEREKLNSNKKIVIYKLCLETLNNTDYDSDSVIYKNCFKFISREDICEDVKESIEVCLKKWIAIDSGVEYLNEHDKLTAYINQISYDKYILLINYLIYLKDNSKHFESIKLIAWLRELINSKLDARCSLCYHLQSLTYILDEYIEEVLPDLIYNNKDNIVDINALMFSTLSGNQLNKHLIKYISNNRILLNYNKQIKEYNDKRVLRRFYSYIIAIYFYSKIEFSDIDILCYDELFIEEYMHSIMIFSKKGFFNFDKYVCDFYNNIKNRVDDQYKKQLCYEMFATLECLKLPTDYTLHTYCDVESHLPDNSFFIIPIIQFISFLDIDKECAGDLIKSVVKKRNTWYLSELFAIVKVLNKHGLNNTSREIINFLFNDKKLISFEEYKNLEKEIID